MPVSHVKAPQSSKSDVDKAIASLHSEKIHLKKLIKIIIINMNKSQESTFFWRAPEIDFCYETKASKVMVDFKFDALYS